MSCLDESRIWMILLSDVRFASAAEPVRKAFECIVKCLPEALRDHLERPLSLASLLDAKAAIAQQIVDRDLVPCLIAAWPPSMIEEFGGQAKAIEAYRAKILETIAQFTSIARDPMRYLCAHGWEEVAYLDSQPWRLDPSTWEAHQRRPLTIGELLELQPTALLGQPPL